MFFGKIGGYYYDQNGNISRYQMWWPVYLAAFVDAFFRILIGKDPVGLPSTRILCHINANTHQPKNQKLSIVMVDDEHPARMIWGTDMTPGQARKLAEMMVEWAEVIEPFYTIPQNKKMMLDALVEQNKQAHDFYSGNKQTDGIYSEGETL